MDLRHILCPVDFSELSAFALRYALMIARCAPGARLTAAYANSFSPPPYFTASRLEELNTQFRDSFREARSALQDFVEKEVGEEAAASVACRVVEALPVDGIRMLASELNANLVVMGTHGRSGVNRLMLGSVAERTLRESEVPVLTVRGDVRAAVERPENVLCPVNDSPAAREALSAAAQLARCFGASLTALHIKETDTARGIGDLCTWVPDEIRSRCSVSELTLEGDPASEIISFARESSCDLLVLGARHRRFFDTTVLGSTVARVVRHAPCPVLTVMTRSA